MRLRSAFACSALRRRATPRSQRAPGSPKGRPNNDVRPALARGRAGVLPARTCPRSCRLQGGVKQQTKAGTESVPAKTRTGCLRECFAVAARRIEETAYCRWKLCFQDKRPELAIAQGIARARNT